MSFQVSHHFCGCRCLIPWKRAAAQWLWAEGWPCIEYIIGRRTSLVTRVKVTGSPPYKATIAAKTSISIHGTRDKLNPPAIASFETSRKVFLDVIPRRVRPLGAEGGLTRIGLVVVGWVRTMWVSQSSKPACGTCAPLSLCPLGSVLAKQDPAGSTVPL